MEEKDRHFLFGIVAAVGLCFIILVFFTGDEVRFDFLSFISIVILLVLFVVLAFDIVLLARILCGCHNETKWHIVTECSQDQELRSKRKLLFHQDITVFPNSVISYCEAVEQVEFAGSDCYFIPGSFEGCANLKYIKLPHRLERIPDNMFRYCSSLKEIIIPSTVKSIGKNAVKGCKRLTSVTFGAGSKLESIGDSAFSECSGLTSVEIPAGVTSIDYEAFMDCDSLTSVTFGESSKLESIGCGAFKGCKRLTSVKIPATVTSIGSEAFYGCAMLTSVEIPAGVTSIGDYAFRGCSGLTSVEIPASVTSIGRGAFKGCSGLSSMKIPVGVTSIGERAFYGCSGLTSVTFGESSKLESIGCGAFKGCSKLTSVKIPVGVTSIGDDAFSGCSRLTSVEIPAGVVDPGLFPAVTGECRVVVTGEITGSTVKKLISMIDGMSAGAKIRLDLSQTTGLTSIDCGAFKGCSKLTSVTFSGANEWCATTNSTDAVNKTGGTVVPLSSTDLAENAKKLVKEYADRCWYKQK